MKPHYSDERVTVYTGDCIEVLRALPDASVDSVVTDPPYGLEFMGKDWDAPWRGDVRQRDDDTFKQGDRRHGLVRHGMSASYGGDSKAAMSAFGEWCELWAAECLRVLKPGGHLLAFGGTRTWHRLAVAIEDAGFEIRDSIAWMYGSGFPKSHNVAIGIDKAAGAMGHRGRRVSVAGNRAHGQDVPNASSMPQHQARTPDAARWQGWGTALKPAHEPIVVARKPLIGTVAANVLEHGTGALNIDGCRVGTDGGTKGATNPDVSTRPTSADFATGRGSVAINAGRWPANVVLDEDQAAALDEQSGVSTSGAAGRKGSSGFAQGYDGGYTVPYGDSGGASRFFYVAKAPAKERPKVDGVAHPTVKPLTLMRWLCRLVTPPGGVILEPFAGSGTTIEAALLEGFNVIAIEREADYLPLIEARISRYYDDTNGQLPLAT